MEAKPCVQTYTFGQHNHHDLGNNHRPLLRLRWSDAPLLPDAIRVPSWRQENGDKRADPRGRVPGDVFDFTRVTGNSKQRRPWHPTQLNEGLVERCVKLTTPPGESILDPFAGTGTTLRVCRRLGYPCTLIEIDKGLLRQDRRRARYEAVGVHSPRLVGGGVMPRTDAPLSPEELVAKTGYEKTPAQRQAALDAASPSQQRPTKKPCVWDSVDFLEWDTWQSLGLCPPAGEERFGNRLRRDENGRRTR